MSTTSIPAGDYTVDPTHTRIGFVARHAMITKVRGTFNDFAGTGHFDPADPSACSINVMIQANSIDTGNADRDGHLRSNDFFDMANFPEITFTSTAIEADGDDYRVTGDLTIKGTTKPVTIDFEVAGVATDPYGNERLGLEGSATINRKDWGISFNAPLEAGGVLIGEKVTLEFDVSAIRNAG